MRLTTSTVLLGIASSAVGLDQHVLAPPKLDLDSLSAAWSNEFDVWAKSLEGTFSDIPVAAKAAWEKAAKLTTESADAFKIQKAKGPKENSRKPDSTWDHVVKGANVPVGAKLDNFSLRAKKVDPSKLGVDTVKQYSGYLDDDEKDKHLFYWFFESRNDPENDPVVLWINGGPGCSSMTGLFMELGPATINEKLEVVQNPYSWNSNASVLFLDQPVNTGFSYGSGAVDNTPAAADDIYALLTLFFHEFPEYAKQNFHISGESYGGHYIPVFATEILSHEDRNINLKSVLIGNGLTDTYNQYEFYRPMACGEGGYPAVLNETTCEAVEAAVPLCRSIIKACYDTESALTCMSAYLYCIDTIWLPYLETGQNPYDVRSQCEDEDNLCYTAEGWISAWLSKPETREALGVESVTEHQSCSIDVVTAFLEQGDWMKPIYRVIPALLEKIPVLTYSGDADFVCNWLGNQAWTNRLEWEGQKQFNDAEMLPLTVNGAGEDVREYGQVKSAHNFAFMRIYEAGHMTPMNEPEGSLDFFNRWLGGEWIA